MANEVRWLPEPEKHDFDAAEDYLSLVMPPQDAAAYRKELRHARHVLDTRKAKDILRAAGQFPPLPRSNPHVAADLAKIAAGEPLSPVLLIRGNWGRPLIIADGDHRICACYWHDENTGVRCVLV